LTITLANLNRLLWFLYHFNREEILDATVANDIILLFAFYDKITLKTLSFNKRREDIDKNVSESKKYGAKRLIKEFPNKKRSKRGVEDFCWWLGVVASVVRRTNEVTVHWARLVLGWVTVFGRVYYHGM